MGTCITWRRGAHTTHPGLLFGGVGDRLGAVERQEQETQVRLLFLLLKKRKSCRRLSRKRTSEIMRLEYRL
jgi:hypothetical protein